LLLPFQSFSFTSRDVAEACPVSHLEEPGPDKRVLELSPPRASVFGSTGETGKVFLKLFFVGFWLVNVWRLFFFFFFFFLFIFFSFSFFSFFFFFFFQCLFFVSFIFLLLIFFFMALYLRDDSVTLSPRTVWIGLTCLSLRWSPMRKSIRFLRPWDGFFFCWEPSSQEVSDFFFCCRFGTAFF